MAGSPRLLELDGYGGAPLPCVLWELEDSSASALVLPGGARAGNRLGGTPARPHLDYTRALLLELGVQVLEVWWDTEGVPRGEDEARWLDANALAGARAAEEASPLRVLVGRSFGTCALARLVLSGDSPAAATIWISPLLGTDDVGEALERAAPSGFVVGGTADPAFDRDTADRLAARGATVARVEDGDHSLDVGDAAASARALAAVLDEMRSFLAERLA